MRAHTCIENYVQPYLMLANFCTVFNLGTYGFWILSLETELQNTLQRIMKLNKCLIITSLKKVWDEILNYFQK